PQQNDPHKVYVCKYVGTPGAGEVLQTGQNPIEVDSHALEGDGFSGAFPFEFSDAHGRSVAIGWSGKGYPELGIESCLGPDTGTPDCNDDYDPENNGPNGDCTVDPDPDPDPDPDDPKDPQDPQVPAGEKPAGGVSASSPDVDPAVTSTHTSNRGDLPFTL
ncbi:MAG: hypothetical protein ABWY50_02210, partial [Aeromicrobium sp.]